MLELISEYMSNKTLEHISEYMSNKTLDTTCDAIFYVLSDSMSNVIFA